MKNRRTILASLAAAVAAIVAFRRGRSSAPHFVEHTPPGNRHREIALGDRKLIIREDLLRSGFYRDLTFHDRGEGRR